MTEPTELDRVRKDAGEPTGADGPPPPARIWGALNRAARYIIEKGGVGKGGLNKEQGYKFRSIEDVMNAVGPALADAGVVCVTQVGEREESFGKTTKGTEQVRVLLRVTFKFVATDGSFAVVRMQSEAKDTSDKATNKALSFAYKYALAFLLCIPFDVAEGDEEDEETVTKEEPKGKEGTKAKEVERKVQTEIQSKAVKATEAAAKMSKTLQRALNLTAQLRRDGLDYPDMNAVVDTLKQKGVKAFPAFDKEDEWQEVERLLRGLPVQPDPEPDVEPEFSDDPDDDSTVRF